MFTEACIHDRSDVMPVTTINLDDFLSQKDSGDIVTGSDWNKLIALFYAVNGNAEALLDVMKNVDTNTANIAQVSQGAVPNGSIGYNKLSKIGGTTQQYVLTTDTVPQPEVTYYTLEGTKYVPHESLVTFESETQYYNLITVATEAAIADSDVIGDGVIQPFHCAASFLKTLLGKDVTVYTDKAISGTLTITKASGDYNSETVSETKTVTLPKAHKALLSINPYSIILFTADATRPNIALNSTSITEDAVYSGVKSFMVRHAIGVAKQNWAPGATAAVKMSHMLNNEVYVSNAYYDTDACKLNFTFSKTAAYTHTQDYKFNNLLIGIC